MEPRVLLGMPRSPRQRTAGGALAQAIDRAFRSFDTSRTGFSKHVNALFGSGWVWLVRDPDGSLIGYPELGRRGAPLSGYRGQRGLMCELPSIAAGHGERSEGR